MKTSLKHKQAVIKNVCVLVHKGSKMIKVMVPEHENIEVELIGSLVSELNNYSILIATDRENELEMESGLKGLGTHYSIINFKELFEKRIEINGKVKRNHFNLLVIDRVPYGADDEFTTPENGRKLTNRINYIYSSYELPIVSLSKSDANTPLRINHFTNKVDE